MLFNARRAAMLLFLFAPLVLYTSGARACTHHHRGVLRTHRTIRGGSQRTLATPRRRKRGDQDRENTTETPQIAGEYVSRDTTRHLAGEPSHDITRPVTPEEHAARRREIVGQNIRAARTNRGISQDQLAAILHVNRRQILRWEAGGVEPRYHLSAIAEALSITVADLYAEPIAR